MRIITWELTSNQHENVILLGFRQRPWKAVSDRLEFNWKSTFPELAPRSLSRGPFITKSLNRNQLQSGVKNLTSSGGHYLSVTSNDLRLEWLLAYPQLLQTKTHFGDGFITLNMRFYSVILYRCSFSIFDVKKNVRFRCSLDLNRLFGHIRVEKNERVDHIQLCTSK